MINRLRRLKNLLDSEIAELEKDFQFQERLRGQWGEKIQIVIGDLMANLKEAKATADKLIKGVNAPS